MAIPFVLSIRSGSQGVALGGGQRGRLLGGDETKLHEIERADS
jgi:hypothetical protein